MNQYVSLVRSSYSCAVYVPGLVVAGVRTPVRLEELAKADVASFQQIFPFIQCVVNLP